MDWARMGVSTIPRAVPARLERVTRPTAVARSSAGNHLAGTLVQALEEGLGYGDADGAGEGQGVAGAREAAEETENGHEHRAYAHGRAEPPGVDGPRGRDERGMKASMKSIEKNPICRSPTP